MKQTSSLLAVLAILHCAACITRAKHAETVGGWENKLGECVAERDRVKTELNAALGDAATRLRSAEASAAAREAELARTLNATREEIAALRKQREETEAQMAQFRKLEEAFRKMIGAGEIKVYRRHGMIMVALPASVLFGSGKADLRPTGVEALAKVSEVLGKLKNRRFVVAGHTDNVPIKTSKFADNWALSAERATVVTRYMIENGVSPKMLAAAGYGEFDPLATNASPNGRQNNRRIEIVLMPNIGELPALPKN